MEQKLAIDFESLVSAVCEAARGYRFHDQRRIESALKAGRHLIEAKDAVQHGDFAALLERAELKPRTAQRWMQLARLGIDADEVRERGGIRAVLFHVVCEADLKRDIQVVRSQIDHCLEKTAEVERSMRYWREQAYALGHPKASR